MPEVWEVQTRNDHGELGFFKTLKEALEHAKIDLTVWKISFTLPSGERCRMVRLGSEMFFLEQMTEAIENLLNRR